MKTFIFGAGASVHAGYPLAARMWGALEDWVRLSHPDDHMFRSVVDNMNASFDMSNSFELVLTDLENRIRSFAGSKSLSQAESYERHIFVQLREAIKSMIPLFFNFLRCGPAKLYEYFATEVLAPGDAVITFNYDLALDREMKRSGKWSVGDGYGFTIDAVNLGNSPCKLLKLHGSTNWRGEVFQGKRGSFQMDWPNLSLGQRPVVDPFELEYLGYCGASDPQWHDGKARIVSLIMPTANKVFFIPTSLGHEWEGFWDSLWSQAGQALSESEEVLLIGYSVPEYDGRARELFATSIAKDAQIKVCCHGGTDGVIESLRRLGLIQARRASAPTFEGWIANAKRE